jgi:hypothetical protein
MNGGVDIFEIAAHRFAMLAMTFVNRFLGKLEMTNRRSSALLFI